MSDNAGTPLGPGFFVFFQQYESTQIKYTPKKAIESDDKECIELVQILHTFIQNQGKL